mmetsp:Transcript_25646/g.35836  ORF Transcript_25646/g.35836 Transcript_25646/m.35836 type:complete len:94 (-) Transcript_25646:536-817(-)
MILRTYLSNVVMLLKRRYSDHLGTNNFLHAAGRRVEFRMREEAWNTEVNKIEEVISKIGAQTEVSRAGLGGRGYSKGTQQNIFLNEKQHALSP